MSAILPLILISVTNFYPTIDGRRQVAAYIEADYPYLLGVSVPPPDLIKITITLDDVLYFDGYCQGMISFGVIESGIIDMSGGGQQFTIVPEPTTFALLLGCIFMRRRV